MLPPGSPEPGKFRSARTPYTIPVVRAFSDPTFDTVVSILGTQTGKTEIPLTVFGHKLDDDPVPMMYVAPTKDFIENKFEPRIQKMLRYCDSLWAKTARGKQNKTHMKRVSGVEIHLAWAGSESQLAGAPVAVVIVDEYSRMAANAEGDVVEQAKARRSNYADGKTGVISSPGVGTVETERNELTGLEHWKISEEVSCPTWKLWQEGTRREWAWPCPDCGEYFIPRFRLLVWPKKSSPAKARREAKLACPNCGVLIDESHKEDMNARGVFVAPGQKVDRSGRVTGDLPDSDTDSYWVSGLCSPWRSFGQRAEAWLKAVRSGDPERIQTVINTGFAELYSMRGDAPPWEEIQKIGKESDQPYKLGEFPSGPRVVTCCVDKQGDRLIYTVRGWSYNLESWLLERGELYGNTSQTLVWEELEQFRHREFGGLQIRRMWIDSGDDPHPVYKFCRRHQGWAFPSKGRQRLEKPIKPSLIDVTVDGQVIKSGMQLWHYDTYYFKALVHSRLDWEPGTAGRWHLPTDIDEDFCKQIVAESRVPKPSGQVVWLEHSKNNHYLDIEGMQFALAYNLQLHMARPPADGEDDDAQSRAAAKKKPRRQVGRSSLSRR